MGQEEVDTETISPSLNHCISRNQSDWFSWTYDNEYDSMDSNSPIIYQSNIGDVSGGECNGSQGMGGGNGQMQILRQVMYSFNYDDDDVSLTSLFHACTGRTVAPLQLPDSQSFQPTTS